MSVGKSGPLIAVGFAIWTIAILTEGDALGGEAWIFFTALALSGLALILNRGDGDEQNRRPPPRWPRGLRPLAADCPAPGARPVRRRAWVPPRLRY